MTDLIEALYPVPDYRRTPWSLLRWWEARRWLYNKVVGATGLVTVAGVVLLAPDRAELVGPELVALIGIYGVLANACYTLGWGAELLARSLWGGQAPDVGPLLFREGLVLSVGVTLLPLLLAAAFGVLGALV